MRLVIVCLIVAFCVLSMAHATTDHTVVSESLDGVITLEDGSVWASVPDETTASTFWVAGDPVVLTDEETELYDPADESYLSVYRLR